MCYDSDGPDAILEDAFVKARKEHPCFACHETIRVGDRHHVFVAIHDGDLGRFRHCLRCWRLIEELTEKSGEGCDLSLNCGESWEGNFGPLPDEIAALAFLTADEAQATLAPKSSVATA